MEQLSTAFWTMQNASNISSEEWKDYISVIDNLENFFPDMFPASCKSDHVIPCTQPNPLDNFGGGTGVQQNAQPHPHDSYNGGPGMERRCIGVPEYSYPDCENLNVRNVGLGELEDVAKDLMDATMPQSHQQHVPGICSQLIGCGIVQSAQEHSYLPVPKQEAEPYVQNLYSPQIESSNQGNSFRLQRDASPGSPDRSERKERRREQNRRAARKCREKKKRQHDSVVKDFDAVREENYKLRKEVEKLNRQFTELTEVLRSHQATCVYGPALPETDVNSSWGVEQCHVEG